MKWVHILNNRYDLEIETSHIDKKGEHIYTVEISEEISPIGESHFVVCDFTKIETSFSLESIKAIAQIINEYSDYLVMFIFIDWENEKETLNSMYELCKNAKDKKMFKDTFKNSTSIYTNINNDIILNTKEKGINYLEHVWDNEPSETLKGFIYTLTFNELKKLYNVTGEYIFRENIRKGLLNHNTGLELFKNFKYYMSNIIYSITSNEEENVKNEINNIIRQEIDIESFEDKFKFDHFWFYHNGITIFSSGKIDNSGNTLKLDPKNVSIINGAQTLTNMFLAADFICQNILSKIKKIKETKNDIKIDDILEKISVKTILIIGNKDLVSNISKTLNTQIPIEKEDLLSASKNIDEINELLKKSIHIIKSGEKEESYKVSLLNFMKHYFNIVLEPGKSKNYRTKDIEQDIKTVKDDITQNTETIIDKLRLGIYIYNWWKINNNKNSIYNSDNKLYQDIMRYGKNYFVSYCIKTIQDFKNIDDETLSIAFSEFKKDISEVSQTFSMNETKKDDLFERIITFVSSREASANQNTDEHTAKKLSVDFIKTYKTELIEILNSESQSQYSFTSTITSFLKEKGFIIQIFRTISMIDEKCTEDFPFPNSTFSEIYMNEKYIEDITTSSTRDVSLRPDFSSSNLKNEINKEFPVFIVKKDHSKKRNIIDINFYPIFTFKSLADEGEIIFQKTLDAFEEGEELNFPKISDNLHFHVRPKAQNSSDTFEFTNGEQITRRTFWANKSTVEALIAKLKNN